MHIYGDRMTYRVYHGDAVDDAEIVRKVQERFGITLSHPVQFVRLSRRQWVESAQYPVLTLLGQALGSIVLALDMLLCDGVNSTPRFVFDSMGYGFAYPVFAAVGGCTVLSYTHYPMISSDMLNRVLERRPQHNNNDTVAASATLSRAKWLYYRAFAWAYGRVGRWSQLSIVNSRWTANHIRSIWGVEVHVVYPAVDTRSFDGFALDSRDDIVISVAQFRPEKDHALQLRAMAALRVLWRERFGKAATPPRLVMIGSVRNAGDAEIVARLKELAASLSLTEGREFEFALNLPFAALKGYLARARVGLHTMWNEHFGIGVVELMAAGVVTIAHNSGGPRMDIVVPCEGADRVGFLAETAEQLREWGGAIVRCQSAAERERRACVLLLFIALIFRAIRYADCIVQAFELGSDKSLQQRARVAAKRFSEEAFEKSIAQLLPRFVPLPAK